MATALSKDTAPPLKQNQTLYCSNLNDHLQKSDLKQALYMLFSTHGTILDIVALKTPRMRGQAHVTFRDTSAAVQAMRALQGYDFFGKNMKIAYAKTKSDTLAKMDGTYMQPVKNAPATTDATKSIFDGPANVTTANVTTANGTIDAAPATASTGLKRARDESDDEDKTGDAPMDQDSDDAMDVSDDE